MKEEIIKYLKENLKISTNVDEELVGGFGDEHFEKILTIKILLEKEVITKSTCSIDSK